MVYAGAQNAMNQSNVTEEDGELPAGGPDGDWSGGASVASVPLSLPSPRGAQAEGYQPTRVRDEVQRRERERSGRPPGAGV